jgi:hypothetical protein
MSCSDMPEVKCINCEFLIPISPLEPNFYFCRAHRVLQNIDGIKEDNNCCAYEKAENISQESWDNLVGAKKYDNGKDRWDLLPLQPIREVVKVFTYGASKYGQDQWQKLDNFEDRYYAAALRHLSAWRLGEENDQESGLHHLAHCVWNIIALLWSETKK